MISSPPVQIFQTVGSRDHADVLSSSPTRIIIVIIFSKVGEHAIDYANVAQKEKLSELQLRVRQLLDQVSSRFLFQNYSSTLISEHHLKHNQVILKLVISSFRWNRSPRNRTTRGNIF